MSIMKKIALMLALILLCSFVYADYCSDADGNNIYTFGWVVGENSIDGYYEYDEVCIGDNVREYWCEGDQLRQQLYACTEGCENGKCFPEEACSTPTADKGDFYCAQKLIYICDSGLWILDEEDCPINYKCANEGAVKSTKSNICIEEGEEPPLPCETDIDCDDEDVSTTDKCVDNQCQNINYSLYYVIGALGLVAILVIISIIFKRRKK